MKPTIHLYLVSLGLQSAVSGDEVVRDMKLTILLYLVSEGSVSGDQMVRDVELTTVFFC